MMIDTKANRPQLSSCPARDELLDFVLGKLPWEVLKRVGEHAEECPTCQAELETLEGVEDSVIRDIKTSSRTPQPFSPELEARIRRAEQIGPEVWSQQQRGQHPDQLGHYQIQQRIGQGGMGTVYRAFHTRLKRPVALKLLPPDKLKEPQAIARFHREMEAIGQLDHANLVRAYDAGEADGHYFLAMEFIEGTDLARLVRSKGPLSVADACEVIRQAAIGLHYAHEHGYVHRDIKPSNLMLDGQGQLKILDLGLASIAEEADEADRDRVLGTGDYVSPEQGQDATAADRRSDIYSLGCTLYFLLCGRAPFGDAEHDTFAKKVTAHAHEAVPPIRDSRDDVPAGLQAVLDRMIEKDAAQRYQTADEVAEALKPFASGSDLMGLLDGDRSKTPPRPRTRNWLWCVAAVLVIGVAAAVMWPWVFPPTEPKLGGDPPLPQPRTITNSIGMELVEVAAGEFKMFMIAWGVFQLRSIPVNPRYASAIGFVAFISVLAVLDAVREHFIVRWPPEMVFALNVFSLVCLGAIVVFCLAMRWFCEEAGLWDAVVSWRLTTALFIVIYVIPLGFFYLAVCYAIATGTSFHFDLGPAGLLLLPVFAIPLIHLFVSTSRMARAAEQIPPEPYSESHTFQGP